jgi:hypothetical protein
MSLSRENCSRGDVSPRSCWMRHSPGACSESGWPPGQVSRVNIVSSVDIGGLMPTRPGTSVRTGRRSCAPRRTAAPGKLINEPLGRISALCMPSEDPGGSASVDAGGQDGLRRDGRRSSARRSTSSPDRKQPPIRTRPPLVPVRRAARSSSGQRGGGRRPTSHMHPGGSSSLRDENRAASEIGTAASDIQSDGLIPRPPALFLALRCQAPGHVSAAWDTRLMTARRQCHIDVWHGNIADCRQQRRLSEFIRSIVKGPDLWRL